MEKLLALKADILCDGHSGIYRPARAVSAYIRQGEGGQIARYARLIYSSPINLSLLSSRTILPRSST